MIEALLSIAAGGWGSDSSSSDGAAITGSPVSVTDPYVFMTGRYDSDGTGVRHDSGAIVKFTCTGPVEVTTYTPLSSGSAIEFRQLAVRLNGAHWAVFVVQGGTWATTLNLPAGSNTVELWEPVQGIGTPVAYVQVKSVRGSGAALVTPVKPSTCVVLYGDSITCGFGATAPLWLGYAALTRGAYSGAVGIDALSGRRVTTETSAAWAANINSMWSGFTNRALVALIGTNDYGNGTPTATFSSFLAGHFDALRGLDAGFTCQLLTPLKRGTETANGVGATLDDYRTIVSAVGAARSSYITVRDGTAIMALTDLADGIHPSDVGHGKLSTAVLGWI